MGAFIYSTNKVNRIVELENECEKERMKEFIGTLGCFAALAMAIAGFVLSNGLF